MGMPVLESEDLVNWRIVGQMFDHIDLPGYSDMTKYAEGTWAPALKYHDGKVWMYVCTPEEGLFMSNADSPARPWEPLHMVKWVAKWEDPCPFWDEDGQAYLVRSRHRAEPIILHRMSADGRVMHLQPVKWVDGWPEIGMDYDGNGVGEPMSIVRKPFCTSANAFTPQTSDEFDGDRLGLQLQFNHNPDLDRISVADGWLSVRPLKATRLRDARNQLTQKIMGYRSEAETLIDWSGMKAGDRSGLLCIGKKFIGAGIEMEEMEGRSVPVLYMEEDSTVVFRKPLMGLKEEAKVYVRLALDTRANRYAYSYSIDGGHSFEPLGEPFEMGDGFWKGVRIGLYSYTLGDEPGETRFERFRYWHDGNPYD